MFCRRVWQRVGPLARNLLKPQIRTPPVRCMAFSVPGGSTNMTYFVLCGGGLTAAMVYAYKTVNSDSERYEDRLAKMGSVKDSLPDAQVPTAEPASVEELATAPEVTAESAPEEPVAETAAEPVVEGSDEAAAEVKEVAPTEEEAPPENGEETPAAVEVMTTEVSPAAADEAPPAEEETESSPDLLTAMKLLAGSSVEIAAASVGERRLAKAVQQIEDKANSLHAKPNMLEGEVVKATVEVVAEGACEEDEVVSSEEEELKPAGVTVGDAVAHAHPEEVKIKEDFAPAASFQEEVKAASLLSALSDGVSPEVAALAEDLIFTSEETIVAETPAEEVSTEAPAVYKVSVGEKAMEEIEAEGPALAGVLMSETPAEEDSAEASGENKVSLCESTTEQGSAEDPTVNEEAAVSKTVTEEPTIVVEDGKAAESLADEAVPEAPPQDTVSLVESPAEEAVQEDPAQEKRSEIPADGAASEGHAEDKNVALTQLENQQVSTDSLTVDVKVSVDEAIGEEVKAEDQNEEKMSSAEKQGEETPAEVLADGVGKSTELEVISETAGSDLEVVPATDASPPPQDLVSVALPAFEEGEKIEEADNEVSVDTEVAVVA